MARSTDNRPRGIHFHPITSIVTLALWRWRQHWFLLLMTSAAMITAVMIVCSVPLLSEVLQTAELRSTLNRSFDSSEITFRATAAGLSSQTVEDVHSSVSLPFDDYLLPYVKGEPRLDVQTPGFSILSPKPPGTGDQMELYATSMQDATSHVRLIEGRLPHTVSQDIEVAITLATARILHLSVGSVITLDLSYFQQPPEFAQTLPLHAQLHLDVVGLFSVKSDDLYWHQNNFLPSATAAGADYTALVSDQTFLSAIDQVASGNRISRLFFPAPSYIYGYYYLNPASISISQLDDIITQLTHVQTYFANHFDLPQAQMVIYPPYLRAMALYGPVLSTSAIPGSLEQFRNRIAILRIPVGILVLLISALLLFLMSVLTGLLVERQAGVILTMRNRGASNGQVLGALVTQSIGCGLIALIIGPPLAVAAAYFIGGRLLMPANSGALSILSDDPVQALLTVKWYAIVVVLAAILTMIGALYRTSRHGRPQGIAPTEDTVKTSSRRPLWQRLHLDISAAIIGITGYSASAYLTNIEGLLDAQTQALVSSPLELIAPIFLLLAALLFLLRFLPLLLQLASSFAQRSRGAIPMLALTQIARSPRQSLRMTLLLALAIAFAIFTLLFSASQSQRAADIAAYQAGADFSGNIPLTANKLTLSQETSLYQHIRGVISATVGYEDEDTVAGGGQAALTVPVQVKAVDPASFARTTIWTAQDSSQSLDSLMNLLILQRKTAIDSGTVPVIVDAFTWNMLALHTGASFSMSNDTTSDEKIRYVVIAEVEHIPTINSNTEGSVLVDYASFAAAQTKFYAINTPINYVWLRTSDNPAALANVRTALNTPTLYLDNLYDRRTLLNNLLTDPLSLTITSILTFGAMTALLLILVGNMLASWLSIRTRLTSLIVLRALGTTPKQIIGILLWEQGIVYAAALLLGVFFGTLLVITTVPALVFTNTSINGIIGTISTGEFYDLQHAIPVQIVFPSSLVIALMTFIVCCLITLGIMVGNVVRSSLQQVLRLEEDKRDLFPTRDEMVIARFQTRQTPSRRHSRTLISSIVKLAAWRLRSTWLLTVLTGVGMVAAVTIVCAIPLFSTVTTTAGLYGILRATPGSTGITLDTTTQGLSTRVAHSLQQQFDPLFQKYLEPYLSPQTSFSIQIAGFNILAPAQASSNAYAVKLSSFTIEQAIPHLTLLQGRFPQATSGEIETLLTPTTAQNLHLKIGSVITLRGDFFVRPQDMFGGPHPVGTLKLRVVGLFNEKPADPFWHGENFQPVKEGQLNADNLLVPSASLLAALDSIAASSHQNVVFSPLTFNLTWYYHLDPSRITIDQLNSLTGQLLHLQAAITNIAGNTPGQSQSTTLLKYPYLLQVNLFSPTPGSFQIPTTLEQYSNRVAVVNIPSTMLSLQVVVLILFFVSLLTNVLIERQADAIALLHSRGASRGQIYSSMFIQSISLCIIALTTGPILALMVVSSISSRILAPGGQDAISIVTGHPVQAVLAIGWYALATVSIALLAIGLILRRAIHTDVFSLRRETTRTTQRPIWQRLHLDLVAAIIALSGYGVSVYLASIGSLLDTRTSVLISAPLSLLAAIFLLIGSLLLFLRFFPYLLRLGARIAGWNRGAAPMLALTHMARSPRQTLRMTMLLSLATAFAIFSLVFAASQAQRIHDIAAYESGADFSGDTLASTHPLSMKAETAKYAAIAGVLSATVGYTGEGFSAGISPNTPIEIRAVDASTFARTAIWTTQDSSQSLASLMTQLTTQRQFAISNNIVPVIADAATMQKLDLRIGSRFIVNVNTLTYGTLNCLVIAEVQHIPTVNNNDDSGTVADYTSPGGILLDYATYAAVYVRGIRANGINGASTLPINHVWLRTSASQPALAHIRTTLDTSGLRLDNLYDRRILIDILDTDPLYLGLIVILTLGTVTTLLLALVGDLLVSWLSVRRRLTSFAVLRALGAAPLQITSVLTWEQGFVYSTALFLGIVFGALLSVTVVPALVFTGVPPSGVLSDISSNEFYIMQHVIPAQVVVPLSLAIVLIALITICMLALGATARTVSQPSLSQTLRLNED